MHFYGFKKIKVFKKDLFVRIFKIKKEIKKNKPNVKRSDYDR